MSLIVESGDMKSHGYACKGGWEIALSWATMCLAQSAVMKGEVRCWGTHSSLSHKRG